ncbi:33063_t:CDS:1, partial [Racocetra persica]
VENLRRRVEELETLAEAQRVIAVERVGENLIRESEHERLVEERRRLRERVEFLESLPDVHREEETRKRIEDIQRIQRMGRDFENPIEINDDDDMEEE